MQGKIELMGKREKRMYLIFGAVIAAVWAVSTYVTEFSILQLFTEADTFWQFLTEDFLPPKLPGGSELVNIVQSVITTVAMAVAATTAAGILAFFV